MENENRYEWGDGVFTLLSWFRQDKVKNAHILVAGAGALGNEVVKNLALFGIGHIYVVDFDEIDMTNLTRSVLFREEDAYRHANKAEIVAKRAMEINPQIKVIPIVGNLSSDVGLGIYRMADVVIGCLDSRLARYQLNRLCLRAGKTWIDGGIENLTGNVRVFTPGVSCYECGLSPDEFNHLMLRTGCSDVVRLQASAGRVATTPVSASVIGAIQVQEAMKIIHLDTDAVSQFKTLQGKLFHYEGMTNRSEVYKFATWRRNCPAHEYWEHIIEMNNLSSSLTVKETLEILKSGLKTNNVEINMRNNKFVDKIIADKPERAFDVMIPDSQLENHIKTHPELRQIAYRTVFHKSFFENIDNSFPYQDLTLRQIGIPPYDVLQVSTEKGLFYVELSADAELFR